MSQGLCVGAGGVGAVHTHGDGQYQNNRKITSIGEDLEKLEPLWWWGCKMVPTLWKIDGISSKKVNLQFPYGPAIPLLGIYTTELEAGS